MGSEGREDVGEVVGADADVGVVNDEVVVAGVLRKLREVADFAVGAEDVGAEDELDGAIGEIGLELADDGAGGIVERGDAEEDFVWTGVVLAAVAGEGFGHAGIDAVDGLEDADGRGKVGSREARAAQKGAGAPEGDEVVGKSGEGEQSGEAGDDGGEHRCGVLHSPRMGMSSGGWASQPAWLTRSRARRNADAAQGSTVTTKGRLPFS